MYQKNLKGWFKHVDFILLDEICLQVAFVISYIIRHGTVNLYDNLLYRNMALFLVFMDFAVLLVFETMKNVLKRGYYRELRITIKQVIFVELLSIAYLFTTQRGDTYSRVVLYMTGVLYLLISYGVRLFWKAHLKKSIKSSDLRYLLLVTDSCDAVPTIKNLKENNYEHFSVAGIVLTDCDRTGEMIDGVEVVAAAETAVSYICQGKIDEILLIPGKKGIMNELTDQLIETGVTIHISLEKIANPVGEKKLVQHVAGQAVLTTSMNYVTVQEAFLKRVLDICGGLVGCIATGILSLIIGPAIKRESPGPIFFTQERIGKNGRKFKMYKFRSMYTDAEERKQELMEQNRIKDGMMFKLDFDPRVIGNKILPDGTKKTGIGQFIRNTSLDEFPQFLNVLKGEMSLCGTRPPTLEEWDQYSPRHRARMSVKPGITGLWQISGRSDITDFDKVVALDTEYIENWSFGLDLKILAKTVSVVLRKDGAA